MDGEKKFTYVEAFIRKMKWTEAETEIFFEEIEEWKKYRKRQKVLQDRKLSDKVTSFLTELGVKDCNAQGMKYVASGIIYVLDNPEANDEEIVKYLVVKFNSTPIMMSKTVDRNIQKIAGFHTPLFEKIFSMPGASYKTPETFFKAVSKYLREVEKLTVAMQ